MGNRREGDEPAVDLLPILRPGDKVGLIACSDGVPLESSTAIDELIRALERFGLEAVTAKTLFRKDGWFSGNPEERAAQLHALFRDDGIKAIFDVSGGDSANQVLPFLDEALIRSHPKPFAGISDLSVLLNGLYARCGLKTVHYRVRNLVSGHGESQRRWFHETFLQGKDSLFSFSYRWIRGSRMEGAVIGGNLRCFLKLAGTRHFPDPADKIMFLESLGGRANRIVSLIAQMEQIGCFERCAGVLLGTFTELEANGEFPAVAAYIEQVTRRRGIPIAKTDELGHGDDGKAVIIGGHLVLNG